MKDFEISYYARYVDDIIIVFNPKPDSDTSNYLDKVDNKIKQIGLSLNQAKTKTINLLTPSPTDFNYLGYHFLIDGGNVNLSISQNKVDNYKKRIESTVNIYLSKSRFNEKKARKLLIKRLRFLTSNTRLLNNKRTAVVGIYFSNSLSTKLDWLDELDDFLLTQLSQVTSKTLKARVSSMSFRDGFEQRRFSKYSLIDLSLIVGAWNHVA